MLILFYLFVVQSTKQLQLNPVQEEMKNSFSIVWGGKEENEYLWSPMDFRGNMTLTLNRGWSRDDAPQPQRWSPGRWHRAVMAVSREEHGMQQKSGTLRHTGYDSVLLKSPAGTVSPVSQCQTKCPAWRAMVLLLCPLLREASSGVALTKRTKGKERQRQRDWGETAHPLHIVLVILCRRTTSSWVCSRESNCWPSVMPLDVPAHSLGTVNSLERSISFPLPSLPASSALPTHPLKVENHYFTGWHHLLRPLSLREGP